MNKLFFLLVYIAVLVSAVIPFSFANSEYIIMSDGSPAFYIDQKAESSFVYMPFEQYDISTYPYVNTTKLEMAKKRFFSFAETQSELGYNSIVIGELIRMSSFDSLAIYDPDDVEYIRAKTYTKFFEELINNTMLDVYIHADFQPMTKALEAYVGDVEYDNPVLIELNRVMISEFFQNIPQAAGLVLRIGEGGKFYTTNQYYASELLYQDVKSTHVLLDTILPIFDQENKTLIFRAWSVGIGEIGDLSSNPNTYLDVFSIYENSSSLVSSIKYSKGDFWYFTEDNPLLGIGSIPQIIEFQLRREYEGYGTVTNFLSSYYGEKIQANINTNPNFAGVYNWLLLGGWDEATNIPYFSDFSLWTELDNNILPKFLSGEELNVSLAVSEALSQTFEDPLIQPLSELLFLSSQIIQDIYYIESYANNSAELRGVPLPKPLWIYWDKPSYDHATFSHLILSTDDVSFEIERTIRGYNTFKELKKDILIQSSNVSNISQSNSLLFENLQYQDSLLEILTKYKVLVLMYYHYLESSDSTYLQAVKSQIPEFKKNIDTFERTYDTYWAASLDFSEVDNFITTIESHTSRQIVNILLSLGFFIVLLCCFFTAIKHKTGILVSVFLFLMLIWSFTLTGFSNGSYFSLFFVGLVMLLLLINRFLYKISKIRELQPVRAYDVLIASLCGFMVITNIFITSFVSERLWLRLYELLIFGNISPWALPAIFFLSFYTIKVYYFAHHLKMSRKKLIITVALDVLSILFVLLIGVQIYIAFFGVFNDAVNLLPSVLGTHGVGPELLDKLLIF